MLRSLCSFLFALTIAIGAHAQIKLMGVTYNATTNTIDLIQWSAFDSTSVSITPTELDLYVFASSAFDPFSGTYYIAGAVGEDYGLYTYNTDSEESNLTPGASLTNIAEFDMSTGKMYNLIMETEEYINVYEYDIAANEESLIGTIYEPGVIGIVTDAIGFDSNNGILYYVGFTNDAPSALYAIPVREESFSFTKTTLNIPSPGGNITSVNFDNVNGKLFATNDVYDENGTSGGRKIVEIDISTGDVETLAELTDFQYFVGGSSQFDQLTGAFLLVGINTNNELKMIAFDTATNTYETGYVPSASEIVCNNTLFARNTYAVAGIESGSLLNFNIYPNPVADRLNIEWASNGPAQLQIFSALGELVYAQNFVSTSKICLDMTPFSSGLYTINLKRKDQSITKKVVVE